MKKFNYRTIIALTIISAGIGYIIYRRINAAIVKKKLIQQLEGHIGETGTADDLGSINQPFDTNYYTTVKSSSLLSNYELTDSVKKLNKAIGNRFVPLSSDEKLALQVFSGLRNKAQVSQIAANYKAQFKTNLLDELKTMDYMNPFGSTFGNLDPVMPKIKKIIDGLPSK